MYIYKTAVVGAGTMGAEIAQTITFAGIPVLLKDVDQQRVDRGLEAIRTIYQRRVQKGKMTPEEMESKVSLATGVTTWDGFQDVDLVIEAVPEHMELKQQIFKELDGRCQPSAILATNTSSLSISTIAAATKRPQKVIGMHFFYPAHIMKLVEVIPGLQTDEETVNDITAFTETLRKLPVRVNECPGFLVNRLLMPYLNEAAYCLQEGAADLKAMDQAMTQFGMPMGPFTLVDALGFDVCHEVVNILVDGFGPRMQPAEIWQEIYGLKRLGVKSGAGFYLYGDQSGQADAALTSVIATVQQRTKRKGTSFTPERLLLPMINEAIICVQEQVCSAAELDLAMLAGIGFPQSKGGILHYADELGLDAVLAALNRWTQEAGVRFWPAPLLKRMVGAGHLGKKSGRGFFDYAEAAQGV